MQSLHFTIWGAPRALERARYRVITPETGGRPYATSYDPKANVLNKKHVQDCAIEAKAKAGMPSGVDQYSAFELVIVYWILKPMSKRRRNSDRYPFPCTKPDLSNCVKLVEDALNGIAWGDDSQICSLRVYKRYTLDEPPRAEVWIRAMRPDESGSPFDKKRGQQMTIDQEAGQS